MKYKTLDMKYKVENVRCSDSKQNECANVSRTQATPLLVSRLAGIGDVGRWTLRD